MTFVTDLVRPFTAPLAPSAFFEAEPDANVRWLQDALNRVMRAGLAVDGISGAATRAAVRAFQSANGLVADGIAGSRTMAALRQAVQSQGGDRPPGPSGAAPVCRGLPERQALDGFAFGQSRLEGQHQAQIDNIAACIAISHSSDSPINRLALIGHTDPVGDDAANDALGLRRATAVADAIRTRLVQLVPTAGQVAFEVATQGERQPAPGDPGHSRRVEVVAPFAFPRERPAPPVTPVTPFRSPLDPPRWGPILVRAVDSNSVIRSGNAVRHLVDAENPSHAALAGYNAMVDAIRSASGGDAFIYLLGWICIDDFDMITCDPTSKLRHLLAAAAARGVQIRAVLWEPAVHMRTHIAQTETSVRRIRALPGGAAIIDGEHLSLGSHHQKLLVVGGGESRLVGFTGGLDVNSDRIFPSAVHCGPMPVARPEQVELSDLDPESMSGGGGNPLHDVHCRVEGPSAFDLLHTFIRRWDHHPDSGTIEARSPLRGRGRAVPPALTGPIPLAKSSTGRSCSVVIGRTFNPRRGSGMPCERNIQRGLLAAIGNARRFIYMEDQYLINPDAAAALRAALPRIDHLTILLSASQINSDTPCIWTYRREFVRDLTAGLPPPLAAKVRLFQLVSPPLPVTVPPCSKGSGGFRPTFGRHTYVHAKCWVFDDELAVIGSANCNRRGWQHDSEIDAFIFDDSTPRRPGERTFAQQMRMDLWAEHLDAPASAFEDGVASAAAWLSPRSSARAVRYCPADGSDIGEFKCGFIRDRLVDPPARCG